MFFKKDLIKPMVLRTYAHGEHERHATWLELFYDLMFVAAIARISDILEHSYSLQSFLMFSGLFIVIWNAWVGQVTYLTRFDSDDIVHRIFSFFQMIALAMLIVNMNHHVGFALSYCALRLILIAEFFFAGMRIPHVKVLTNYYAAGFLTSVAVWLVSTSVPSPWWPITSKVSSTFVTSS
jgi:low temperature requirement protein LtrA